MSEPQPQVSKLAFWAGWVSTVLPVVGLLFSAVMKLIQPEGMEEGVNHLGWQMKPMFYIGIIEAACAIIYVIPRTAVLGAILLTGYLGGAIATHVRIGEVKEAMTGAFIMGVMIWCGLYLRDPRLRALVPFRKL